MMKKTKEDKTKVFELCLCPQCPSWVECKETGGYCLSSVGKSKCIKKEKGCICGGCPIHQEMKLQHGYFCTRGSEKEQTK